jgi:Alpha-amylase/alpha-mannosidase
LRGRIGLLFTAHQVEHLNRALPHQRLSMLASGGIPADKYIDMERTNREFLDDAKGLYAHFLGAVEEVSQEADKLGLPFRVGLAPSGIMLELVIRHSKGVDLYGRLSELVKSGRIELVATPYHQSLASLYQDRMEEFGFQLALSRALIQKLFGVEPRAAVNTHMGFSDGMAASVERGGFSAMVAEAPDIVPGVYAVDGMNVRAIVRDRRLSGAILEGAYEATIPAGEGRLAVIRLGTLRGSDPARFAFIFRSLLSQEIGIVSPSDVAASGDSGSVTQPDVTPRFDVDVGGLDAFLGNAAQRAYYRRVAALGPYVRQVGDREIAAIWRILQQVDFLAYLSEAGLPGYTSPYSGWVEAFSVMDSVLSDVEGRVGAAYARAAPAKRAAAP